MRGRTVLVLLLPLSIAGESISDHQVMAAVATQMNDYFGVNDVSNCDSILISSDEYAG